MSFFKKIWNNTLINILYRTIYHTIQFKRDYNQCYNVFYSQGFIDLVRTYLKIDLDKDWIGRLYGVINPNLDINGNFDPGTVIIEIDGENTNTDTFVKNWLYRQLSIMTSVFRNLGPIYDKLNVDIKHVGPKEHDNYLIVFDFYERIERRYWLKRLFKRILFLSIISVVIILGFLFFI
jgi:hypothetical protein